MTSRTRSAAWRARRRTGAIPISIDIMPAHRRALESMGLIPTGKDRDAEALIWAVERFLDIAPAVQGIGDALYRKLAEFAPEEGSEDEGEPDDTDDSDTVSPGIGS